MAAKKKSKASTVNFAGMPLDTPTGNIFPIDISDINAWVTKSAKNKPGKLVVEFEVEGVKVPAGSDPGSTRVFGKIPIKSVKGKGSFLVATKPEVKLTLKKKTAAGTGKIGVIRVQFDLRNASIPAPK